MTALKSFKPATGPDSCRRHPAVSRRDFLKELGAAAAVLGLPELPIVAGPFTAADFDQLVPADKRLRDEWVRSLFARGAPTVYRWPDSRLIGMPVGGLCAGQLYLGGDGRLWRWDIFNRVAGTGDARYAHPPDPDFPVDQGFALRWTDRGHSQVRALDHTGWGQVSFLGEYPIGSVEYQDPALPLSVSLEAFSPFIPLDTRASALPATILRFTVRNGGPDPVKIELAGWLENAVCRHSARPGAGQRQIRLVRRPAFTFLECSAQGLSSTAGEAAREGVADSGPARAAGRELREQPDFGTMGLALLGRSTSTAATALPEPYTLADVFSNPGGAAPQTRPFGRKLVGALGCRFKLAPGRSASVVFVVAWHFPSIQLGGLGNQRGRWYGKQFADALAVASHVARHYDRFRSETRLWHDTWYDSTLPRWFLDRTFLNTSTLATSTCYWFGNGRFYAWEGVGCCAGTCTHVWHYAQAVGRLFPPLERSLREMVDYGVAFDPATGRIRFRAEHNNQWAVDGQSGCILRTYREHQMSADNTFLQRLWPRVRKSIEFLISRDVGPDGIIDGPQHNTLDADWWGQVAWLSSLYLAALRAGEEMARETGDDAFAKRCREIFERGRRGIDQHLFNGEYFFQLPDPAHARTVGSYNGCEIDQVFGQSWAWQVGLGRVLDAAKVKQALHSLWCYNFTPDVGAYRRVYRPGRWFAMAGEGGLIMCTWPRGEAERVKQGFDYYFNECMTGFEYQVAGHMIREGMAMEGLAVTRMVHDRYHAARRNPWNEVECGDHYARAMASYGVFLAACGYEYHGPKRRLGFAPRLMRDEFRSAFTTAEGWGTFAQHSQPATLKAQLTVRWGRLRLRTLTLAPAGEVKLTRVTARLAGKRLRASVETREGRSEIQFASTVTIRRRQQLRVELTGP